MAIVKKIEQVLFDMRTDPLTVRIAFTTQVDEKARKVPGNVRVEDDAAVALVAAVPTLIDAVNKAIDDAATVVAEPGAVAARIQAAQEAEDKAKTARIAQRQAEAMKKDLDKQIAEKTAELAEVTKALEAKKPPTPVTADPLKHL